ncbi:MAG: CotH kinase family protein [Bacteroidales bacterium]|nr:CotH kinase family protein [Bacteroidales bacterium]MBN2634230.1 CotH kinase family protein [Bacteroidales bacterium]
MRSLILILLLFTGTLQLRSQVLINEFCSSNFTGIKDEDGDLSDWIELLNTSSSTVNLKGYSLSDNAGDPTKWTFPELLLDPGAYLLVFASDKDRSGVPLSRHTVIDRGSTWKYLVPESDIGEMWKTTAFDDSGWNSGQSGFGYGDNDDSTKLDKILSVYLRKELVIDDPGKITELILSIDYDDGFAAFINGHEIARANLGEAGSAISFNEIASASREATMYNGAYPVNFIVSNPSSLLVEGVNVLCVEGHNRGETSSDFTLIPMLTVGTTGTGYSENMPEYINLKGEYLHTSFKIDRDGETLILSKPGSVITDSVSPVQLPADISYGRNPDGKGTWSFFYKQTPGKENNTEGFSILPPADSVYFSRSGGHIDAPFTLVITAASIEDTIYYTLDGSEPSRGDSVYKVPLNISDDCVVRARTINHNKLPGVISTHTYRKINHSFPVFCISTDPENLWDYYTGIYVMGPNASPESPFKGANFWQDWEKRAHMEFYDENGIRHIDQDIGVKIFGAYSRARNQKSLAFFARREYGKGSFEYKFFDDKPIDKFESIVLRNGGNDWGKAIIRDGITSTLVRDMNIDRMAFRPAILYLNGEYWGILNLREKVNTNYLASNHQVDPENINLLEKNSVLIEGSSTAYKQIISFLNSTTLESELNYNQISRQIDLDNYIQYQLTQIYIDNRDWPGNNIKYWNTNDPGSRWRWIIFDTDFGYSMKTVTAYEYNTLEFALRPDGTSGANIAWATLLFRRMMSNHGFRNQFINQYADRINTTFTHENLVSITDSIRQIYLSEIQNHVDRWGLSLSNWENSINNIRTFAYNRPSHARQHLIATLGLDELLNLRVEIRDPGSGKVKINSVIPDKYPFAGFYFRNIPIKLTAVPSPGYKFIRWEAGGSAMFTRTIDYKMTGSTTIRAVFGFAGGEDNRLVINEINYNSAPGMDPEDWVELYNAGNSTVNLKGWTISDASVESGFKIGSDLLIEPGGLAVICREQESFIKTFPGTRNTTGNMVFGLNSTGDDINLFDPSGLLIDFVNYTPNPPWPVDANGTGATIELTDPFRDNNLGQNWRSRQNGGSPGEKNLATGTEDLIQAGEDDDRLDCFPNPFSDFTTICFTIKTPGRYRLEVLDLQGRVVKTIADHHYQPDTYIIEWRGDGNSGTFAGTGVYFLKLTGKGTNQNIKVIITG